MSVQHTQRYVSPREYAALYNISTSTVLRLINSGELDARRFGPRTIRIPLGDDR